MPKVYLQRPPAIACWWYGGDGQIPPVSCREDVDSTDPPNPQPIPRRYHPPDRPMITTRGRFPDISER